MSPRKEPHPKNPVAKAVAWVAVLACLGAASYFFKEPLKRFFQSPPRADLTVLHAAVDSAMGAVGASKLSRQVIDLGDHQIIQDRAVLSRGSSMLRTNQLITRAVEKAGGRIEYGIDSSDERRRWQIVTLGISDGDSLIREVRLERRLR